jgi:hypothetical protein
VGEAFQGPEYISVDRAFWTRFASYDCTNWLTVCRPEWATSRMSRPKYRWVRVLVRKTVVAFLCPLTVIGKGCLGSTVKEFPLIGMSLASRQPEQRYRFRLSSQTIRLEVPQPSHLPSKKDLDAFEGSDIESAHVLTHLGSHSNLGIYPSLRKV